MNLHIQSESGLGPKWFQHGNLFVKGHFWFRNVEGDLASLERALNNAENNQLEVEKVLNHLNGSFALLYKKAGATLAAVDFCRSMPILFDKQNIYGTDVGSIKGLEIELAKLQELKSIEFIQGNDTLYKNVKQIQAGEYVLFKNEKSTIRSYFSHKRNENEKGYPILKRSFAKVCTLMEKQLESFLDGRLAVVPLSGGYDSRFILAMLAKIGYSNVLAITYGNKDGFEAQTAKEVAAKLGVKWKLVEYNKALFKETSLKDFEKYCQYSHGGVSVPQEQEFFALKFLKECMLNSNAVFLPGFCGDVQAGSFIPDKFYQKKWQKKHVSSKEYLGEKLYPKAKVRSNNNAPANFESFYSEIEEWILREREAKYIINGVRAYEFFGFNWFLPLWNREFIEFWRTCPSEFRRDRSLYIDVLNDEYFTPLGIDFKPKGFDSQFKSGNLSTRLKYILPKPIKDVAKKLLIPKKEFEINNLNYLAVVLAKEMGRDVKPENVVVNEVMGEYLTHLLAKRV